jgi:hypothetical protein
MSTLRHQTIAEKQSSYLAMLNGLTELAAELEANAVPQEAKAKLSDLLSVLRSDYKDRFHSG